MDGVPRQLPRSSIVKRRDFLTTNVLLAGSAAAATNAHWSGRPGIVPAAAKQTPSGNVQQSIMGWCFKPMDAITLAKHCKRIGLEAMEGIPATHYDEVTKLG